jgi:Protein of unknown function (DUF3619)
MNEDQIGAKARNLLNQGLTLDSTKVSRLRAAREQALARQRQESWVLIPQWAGRVFVPNSGPARLLLPLVFGILALIAFQYFQTIQTNNQIVDELVEIDAGVLKGELPIDAYLDSGFQAWLKKSSE